MTRASQFRAAVAKAPEDATLNLNAYSLAVSAGHDRRGETNGWLASAIAASGEDGPVFSQDFDDVIAMMNRARSMIM